MMALRRTQPSTSCSGAHRSSPASCSATSRCSPSSAGSPTCGAGSPSWWARWWPSPSGSLVTAAVVRPGDDGPGAVPAGCRRRRAGAGHPGAGGRHLARRASRRAARAWSGPSRSSARCSARSIGAVVLALSTLARDLLGQPGGGRDSPPRSSRWPGGGLLARRARIVAVDRDRVGLLGALLAAVAAALALVMVEPAGLTTGLTTGRAFIPYVETPAGPPRWRSPCTWPARCSLSARPPQGAR